MNSRWSGLIKSQGSNWNISIHVQLNVNVPVCRLSRSGTMLEGYSPVTQALLGTLFTWALTAAGAALVFVFSSRQVSHENHDVQKKKLCKNYICVLLKKGPIGILVDKLCHCVGNSLMS